MEYKFRTRLQLFSKAIDYLYEGFCEIVELKFLDLFLDFRDYANNIA
ncbi:hypothetical protein FACS1894111_11080 [Clostridia bacterium]|nr:hypothetical protein FACS1894111_11080 [Clostridia bacterium]